MTRRRKRLLEITAAVIILPVIAWGLLYYFGLVSLPGDPLKPPFNLSDRIVSIEVEENDDGSLVATFDGWKEGDRKLTAEEFYEEIYRRKQGQNWFFKLLDVTSVAGLLWVFFGFLGQAVFTGRMIVQWRASEKAKSSVVPPIFWWMSLLGATMLIIYFIWRKEIVGFLGQSTGWFIYIRNLWWIYGQKREPN